jgi:fibronectin type 3 domain-containing protein
MKKLFWLLPVFALLFAWPGRSQTKTHSISLTWTAGSGDVTFNVYRSTTSGSGYTKIGSSATTNYVDSSGTGGVKYFYVVTGVDAGGFESANSNEASATMFSLPNPPTGLAAVSN